MIASLVSILIYAGVSQIGQTVNSFFSELLAPFV